ncbi:MAG: RnfABCDGE type electron transport complex subunit G [bacterium]
MKEIVKYGFILMVVCTIAAVSLAYTYSKTKPLIDKQASETAERTKNEVLPGVSSFKEVVRGGSTFYVGYNEKGEVIGSVTKVAPKGYAGAIDMMVGLSDEGLISGVKILNHLETPGLGAKITEDAFLEQFKGKKASTILLKKGDSQGTIDAITAATISSRAVTGGVREAAGLIEGRSDE